eukprot:TRINITY_DN92_c0_g1_i1.p1 TRINITY_DN92_c0_g1~~TRINITY_DN92_c0_g1_i1.p1  ORF type:complete len:182 (-),score=40.71 TRINITY_DN92_c0_g1_i1:232-777(-)
MSEKAPIPDLVQSQTYGTGYQAVPQHPPAAPYNCAPVMPPMFCAPQHAFEARTSSSSSRSKPSTPSPIFMFPENELITDDTSCCAKKLLRAFNTLYRWGFNFIFYSFLILGLLLAPFIGATVAMFEFVCHFARIYVRPLGKFFLDFCGVGTYLNKKVEHMDWQMRKPEARVQVAAPVHEFV